MRSVSRIKQPPPHLPQKTLQNLCVSSERQGLGAAPAAFQPSHQLGDGSAAQHFMRIDCWEGFSSSRVTCGLETPELGPKERWVWEDSNDAGLAFSPEADRQESREKALLPRHHYCSEQEPPETLRCPSERPSRQAVLLHLSFPKLLCHTSAMITFNSV